MDGAGGWIDRIAVELHRLDYHRLGFLLEDGLIIGALVIVLLLLHLRRVLRELPRNTTLLLAAIFVAGLAIRLIAARETIMNAWPYQRIVPLAGRVAGGEIIGWLAREHGLHLYLTDVIFRTDLVIASLTPVVLFAHARYLLRDHRGALVAAAIMAVLPLHIRFSRSDTEILQSICSSSLTFVVLYTALRERSAWWRRACFLLLPALSLATYWVRPENMVFYVLDLLGILLTAGPDVPIARRVVAAVEVTVAAAVALWSHLLATWGGSIGDGVTLQTLRNFVALVLDPQLNTIVNPRITPPIVMVLAVAGAVLLWRAGERLRAAFLVGWIALLFLVISFIKVNVPAMQARYHLNLITPLCVLAAASLIALLRARPRVGAAVAAWVALSPVVHLGFIRDTAFNEIQEFEFLTRARDLIPPGCTIIEYSPSSMRDGTGPQISSRLARIGALAGSRAFDRFEWRVINAWRPPSTENGPDPLAPEARAALSGSGCLFVYQGLTCLSHRETDDAPAAACEVLRPFLPVEPVAETVIASRIYDEVNAGWMIRRPSGLTRVQPALSPGRAIPLSLYRVRGNPP